MITTAIVDTTTTDEGMRMIKAQQIGAKEPYECSPYGMDSNPVEGLTAIYADTSENGEPVIIGYINENQIAQQGETRLFCAGKAYVWLKEGDIELGGNARTIVAYQDLKRELESSIDLLNIELKKIQAAITGLGGAYTEVDVILDISSAEVGNVKTL